MIELNVNNLTKYYGANKIFENISFEIKTGERIGLIGANGCGKTTLMKILMGLEEYRGGSLSYRKDNKISYLNQIPSYPEGTTTMEVLRMAFEEVFHMKNQMEELEQRMIQTEGLMLDQAVKAYSRLQEQYEHSGGYEIETKLSKIAEGLQIDDDMKEMQFDKLSGGEKTRVILAKILLEEPDILLLDEPTNHLDLVTIEWLESFLKDYRGACLIISHDRYFLDGVAQKIIELQKDHAELYLGNYSYYVIEKERRFLLELKNYQNQQKKLDRMEEQIKRYRIWGVMRDSEKMFRRAKELEKRLEKIEVLERPAPEKRKIRLNQAAAGRSGRIVLETSGLRKAFGSRALFNDVTINIFYQDSACILGENGCGKTTLLKMILGEIEPDAGAVKIGAGVMIGYLPQQVEFEDEEQTILEYFSRYHSVTYSTARSQLAKILFTEDDVFKKIKFLSGGEKSRLKLCSLTFSGVNFLVLDEPTNHLDIDSREVLEETLSDFEGTILFVSHDRYFINKVADKIITIENAASRVYQGDYLYYQEEFRKLQKDVVQSESYQEEFRMLKKNAVQSERKENAGSQTLYRQTDPSKESGSIPAKDFPSAKAYNHGMKAADQLKQLEESIDEMESKVKQLDELMNIHNSNSNKLREIFEERERTKQELLSAYNSWEEMQVQDAIRKDGFLEEKTV